MDLNNFKSVLFEKAKQAGFENAEIFFSRSAIYELRIFEKEIASFENTDLSGVSFRGVIDGTMGYSFSERIDLDVIDFLIKNAKEHAAVNESPESQFLYKGDSDYENLSLFNEELTALTPEQKENDAKRMETAAYAADSRVKSVDSCVFSLGESETFISNTLGLDLKSHSSLYIAYAVARIEENGEVKVGSDYIVSNDYKKFNPELIGENAVKKAIDYLGATSLKTGNYKVIIENEAMISLFGNFVKIFFAENVHKGFSLLKDKIGEKIASEVLTIRDDALLENELGSSAFDDEGVKTADKVVVENGILKTYLYNLKTAEKDNVKSTGNGFKSNFKSYVETSGTNFYIENGKISFEDLVKEVGDGIIIRGLNGLHSGINTISGDFSLLADGFKVENGKVSNPIEQFTVAGNFFELLQNIENISNDFKFGMPSAVGNVGAPSVFIKSLSVAGE